jgi:nucleotide-binding universal stress UspA family protein
MLKRARDALATAAFDEVRSRVPQSMRASIHTVVGEQTPSRGLLLAADEWRADMIAVGARGLGPLERLMLGSVSTSVVHAANIPVLVARSNPQRKAGGLRILLACDGSPVSQHAAELLARFTWPPDATGTVVVVIESMFAGELPEWLVKQVRDTNTEAFAQAWVKEHDSEREAKKQEMLAYRRQLPESFQQSQPLVAEGHPAEQILRAIDTVDADLVVLGARGLGRWGRLLIGSTSEKVLAHAPCSVLIVRQPKPA